MIDHDVSVIGSTETYTNRYIGRESATRSVIEVRPPIVVGEGFNKVVLGQDQNGIHLEHVYSDGELTAFAVEAALHRPETCREMIETVAQRIGQLVNGERDAVLMALENPFPAYQAPVR